MVLLRGSNPDTFSQLDPVMDSLGFTKPVPTGSCCGLYEATPSAAVALALFIVVKGINLLQGLRHKKEAEAAAQKAPQETEVELLRQIRDALAQRRTV